MNTYIWSRPVSAELSRPKEMLMWVTWTAFIATISTKWVSSLAFALWCLSSCTFIFVDNWLLIIFYWEDLLLIICFYVRLKSKPFKVTPGLLTTLNPPWRWAGKSSQRLTSSSPLEGSLQLWVTTKFQVSHTDISLWSDDHLCFAMCFSLSL